MIHERPDYDIKEVPVEVVKEVVRQTRGGRTGLRLDASETRALAHVLERSGRRREAVTIGAAILLGGLIWLAVNRDFLWPGWAMLVLGAGWILIGRSR